MSYALLTGQSGARRGAVRLSGWCGVYCSNPLERKLLWVESALGAAPKCAVIPNV